MDTDYDYEFPFGAEETLTRYRFRRGLCIIRLVIMVR
jgi:hypothetical protein